MGYACKILADSISLAGHRITTFEVTFPRIVLAEVNTHCMLARCSASSRAQPVPKKINAVQLDPFIPEAFGRNQKGMQPGEALDGQEDRKARELWVTAASDAVYNAGRLAALGVHKQYANRLLEPFSWHTAVITATEWDNFEHLRVNPMAQGEFQTIARMMKEAREHSEPRKLLEDEWHMPYVGFHEGIELQKDAINPVKVSVARCARVSTLTQDGVRDSRADVALYERLLESGHMSPLEHVARPMTKWELLITESFDIALDDGPILRVASSSLDKAPTIGDTWRTEDSLKTITYARGPVHFSAKFNGWVSRRQFVHGEHDILGHRAAK